MLEKFRSREAAMPFIMLAVLIDMAAIGVIIPVLPALVGSFSVNQADQAYWYGVTAVAFGLSNFLAAPVLGALSDRYGRRPVLLLGFMGSVWYARQDTWPSGRLPVLVALSYAEMA